MLASEQAESQRIFDCSLEYAVDDEMLLCKADVRKLGTGTLGFCHSPGVQPGNQHYGRTGRIRQCIISITVAGTLASEAGERADTGNSYGIGIDVAGPSAGQR